MSQTMEGGLVELDERTEIPGLKLHAGKLDRILLNDVWDRHAPLDREADSRDDIYKALAREYGYEAMDDAIIIRLPSGLYLLGVASPDYLTTDAGVPNFFMPDGRLVHGTMVFMVAHQTTVMVIGTDGFDQAMACYIQPMAPETAELLGLVKAYGARHPMLLIRNPRTGHGLTVEDLQFTREGGEL
jgi:hypothetical protein